MKKLVQAHKYGLWKQPLYLETKSGITRAIMSVFSSKTTSYAIEITHGTLSSSVHMHQNLNRILDKQPEYIHTSAG